MTTSRGLSWSAENKDRFARSSAPSPESRRSSRSLNPQANSFRPRNRTHKCCGDAEYNSDDGTWTGTHENQNAWHSIEFMAKAAQSPEIPPLSPLPTPPSRGRDVLPSTNIPVGIAASQNPPERPQNERLNGAFERVRRESLQGQQPVPLRSTSSSSTTFTQSRHRRSSSSSQAAAESRHTTEQVLRATIFAMQYDLTITPEGARAMMHHERPDEVEHALYMLEVVPGLRFKGGLGEMQEIVARFLRGEEVGYLL